MTDDEHRELDAWLDEQDQDRLRDAELVEMADLALWDLDFARWRAVEDAEVDIERQMADVEREFGGGPDDE